MNYSGKKEYRMPLIEVHMLEGRTTEQKKALLAAITDAVHESIGSPLPTIRVWIQEMSKKEYMVAGRLAEEYK
ncbi:2-hydroxymuconate tautomerase [Acidobacteriota bacterium]